MREYLGGLRGSTAKILACDPKQASLLAGYILTGDVTAWKPHPVIAHIYAVMYSRN